MVQSSLFMCSKFVDSKSLTEHRPLTLSHLFICFELSFPLPLIKWITWLAFELLFPSPLVSGKALDGEIASEWVFPASHAGKVAQGGELLQYRWKPRTTQFWRAGTAVSPWQCFLKHGGRLACSFLLRKGGFSVQRWAVNNWPLLGKLCPRSSLMRASQRLLPLWNGARDREDKSLLLPP